LLIEFEDTFPYEGNLKPLRGINFYTKDQISELVILMRNMKLKLIPLVQTFGHLEFVLKRDRFSHLRE
jgi:hexosaminidase